MKKIHINVNKKFNRYNKFYKINNDDEIKSLLKIKSIFNNDVITILVIINSLTNIYLLVSNIANSVLLKKVTDFKNTYDYKNKSFINDYPYNDKEMIGIKYPDIEYNKIKSGLNNYNIIASLVEFINQMEVKLIYLEKEINLTKIVSFYTSRKTLLKEYKINYDETKLTELHDIINWLTIHKSDQLKGIASDKYLACKYVQIKLGENLCQQRIVVYNKFEELNYEELSKYGDIVLKISNSCWKNTFIEKVSKRDVFENKLRELKLNLKSEHGLVESQFFHLYPKKRIVVESQFTPITDFYEFKFYIINNKIKFIYFKYHITSSKEIYVIYDPNYNFLYKKRNIAQEHVNITDKFEKNTLEKIKQYAIKLSEDFPIFIRVDLYIFQNKIYLSELTFASYNGKPFDSKEKYIKDSVINISLINDYL